jgi:hypothetical protein
MGWLMFWIIYTLAAVFFGVWIGKVFDPKLEAKYDGLYLSINDGGGRARVKITRLIHS